VLGVAMQVLEHMCLRAPHDLQSSKWRQEGKYY